MQGLGGFNAVIVRMKMGTYSIFKLIMIVAVHYLKIVRGVVGSVSVNVMNYFIAFQGSAQHLFGNRPMLINEFLSHLAYDAVSRTGNMATLPVPMIFPVQSLYVAFGNGGTLQLFKSPRAKSWISKILVLLCGHVVSGLQVFVRYLCAKNFPAKLTLDHSFGI